LTGFSAAIIAAAIHRQHGNSREISVETIDASAQCIIDETRPVGFEISELIPDLVSTVRVHTQRKSDFARELGARGEFEPFEIANGAAKRVRRALYQSFTELN
jgi:hypothetical protein